MKYLLDTNIIIYWLKGRYGIGDKITEIGLENCYISEITIAELFYGVACSDVTSMEEKRLRLERAIGGFSVVPFKDAIQVFAKEKARLRLAGEIIADFDILIGACAIENGYTLVTNNIRHLSRMDGIALEDWTIR